MFFFFGWGGVDHPSNHAVSVTTRWEIVGYFDGVSKAAEALEGNSRRATLDTNPNLQGGLLLASCKWSYGAPIHGLLNG